MGEYFWRKEGKIRIRQFYSEVKQVQGLLSTCYTEQTSNWTLRQPTTRCITKIQENHQHKSNKWYLVMMHNVPDSNDVSVDGPVRGRLQRREGDCNLPNQTSTLRDLCFIQSKRLRIGQLQAKTIFLGRLFPGNPIKSFWTAFFHILIWSPVNLSD